MIGVTGATGRLGGRVARRLSAAGIAQRLLVRDPTRAPALPGAEPVRCSYDDPAAAQALAGIDVLLMVSAGETERRVDVHRAFVAAAVRAGVPHVVYTSFFGAARDATFTLARDHWATEEQLRGSGLAWTFLRDNMYLDFLPLLAGEDGVIRGPAEDGAVAAVALDDIADVAHAVLAAPDRHTGATYALTGPADLTLDEVAAVLSQYRGRPVRYERETVEEAYASRTRYGAPRWQLDAWVSTYTAIAKGELAGVTETVERISGHPPRSLEQVIESGAGAAG